MLLSYDDLQIIKKMFAVKDKTLASGEDKKAFTTGIDSKLHPLLAKILSKYINFDRLAILNAFSLESFTPWSIHTDYPKGDADPAIAILIPLETTDSHTVVFNEECLDDFIIYARDNPDIPNNDTKEKWGHLLTHINENYLRKVTVKSAESWIEGKIIIWDRKLLHCSDDYKSKGIQTKQAAVIFTSYL